MNRLILLVLLNILVYYIYKINKYLLIFLFIIMIYYTLRISKNIEGNEFYKYNFAKSLNDETEKNRDKDNLFNIIIDKLNVFLEKYLNFEKPPDDQPCVGIFTPWSECSTTCGRGEKNRRFDIIQQSGKDGIQCIFKNGQIDKKDCYTHKCSRNEKCNYDLDCDTEYCNPKTKRCGLKYECTRNTLHNCDYEQCIQLGENYHYSIENGCQRYILEKIIN